MRMKNHPLILGLILSGGIGMAVAGCSQTSSSADRYAYEHGADHYSADGSGIGFDRSDCNSSWGGARVGTGAGSNGSSATDEYSGSSGCVPIRG